MQGRGRNSPHKRNPQRWARRRQRSPEEANPEGGVGEEEEAIPRVFFPKSEHKEDTDKVHRVERTYGSFTRSFRLPDGVDASAVTAKFDNGQLRIEVPKPPQVPQKAKREVAITE